MLAQAATNSQIKRRQFLVSYLIGPYAGYC